MIEEISLLIDQYRAWLKEKTVLREINNDYLEITTPFVDRHNDLIQIYTRRENGEYLLTDDNYTIDDLAMAGCHLDTPKRQEILKTILAGFGVKNDKGALVISATKNNFSLQKHNLIQAILSVNDLFYCAESYVKNMFLEDVTAWLDGIGVRYIPNIKFSGQSGYDHVFDFVIPLSKSEPERLLRVINNPTKAKAESFVFSWVDTRDARKRESKAYAILNDQEKEISPGIDKALNCYDIISVRWSGRDKFSKQLIR